MTGFIIRNLTVSHNAVCWDNTAQTPSITRCDILRHATLFNTRCAVAPVHSPSIRGLVARNTTVAQSQITASAVYSAAVLCLILHQAACTHGHVTELTMYATSITVALGGVGYLSQELELDY